MLKRIDKTIYQKEHKLSKIIKLKNKIVSIIVRNMILPNFRIWLYRIMGVNIGENVFIGLDCYIDDEVPTAITIEDNVIIAFRVTIAAHDDSNKTVSPVIIHNDVFIGTGSVILGGVNIGRGAIIGAGSIVRKDVPEYSVTMGNPAKVMN